MTKCVWCNEEAGQEVQIAAGTRKRMPRFVSACATHAQWVRSAGETQEMRERREHIARGQITLEQILGGEA